MHSLLDPPESICLLRMSALGDVTHVVPVIRTLQKYWPEVRISWIIGVREHRLLSALPGIEFIVFDKRGGWRAVNRLRRALQGRRFDFLLHMQLSTRANLLSSLVRARVRLGWDRPRSREFHHWFINAAVRRVPFQHQVQAFLEFPRALGLEVAEPCWNLPISEAARAWACSTIDTTRRTLVISPCSSHAARNWRAEHYSAVADFASSELGMQVVLSGGPGQQEREMGANIESKMQQRCLNLVGQDTLEQSMALFRQADLLLSPDSGPVHIASALGTDVLGLYAATWSRRSGPYNSLDLCVDRFGEAARRFRNKAPEQLRWGSRIEAPGVMDLIHPGDVIQRLARWHERSSPKSAS